MFIIRGLRKKHESNDPQTTTLPKSTAKLGGVDHDFEQKVETKFDVAKLPIFGDTNPLDEPNLREREYTHTPTEEEVIVEDAYEYRRNDVILTTGKSRKFIDAPDYGPKLMKELQKAITAKDIAIILRIPEAVGIEFFKFRYSPEGSSIERENGLAACMEHFGKILTGEVAYTAPTAPNPFLEASRLDKELLTQVGAASSGKEVAALLHLPEAIGNMFIKFRFSELGFSIENEKGLGLVGCMEYFGKILNGEETFHTPLLEEEGLNKKTEAKNVKTLFAQVNELVQNNDPLSAIILLLGFSTKNFDVYAMNETKFEEKFEELFHYLSTEDKEALQAIHLKIQNVLASYPKNSQAEKVHLEIHAKMAKLSFLTEIFTLSRRESRSLQAINSGEDIESQEDIESKFRKILDGLLSQIPS